MVAGAQPHTLPGQLTMLPSDLFESIVLKPSTKSHTFSLAQLDGSRYISLKLNPYCKLLQ